MPYWQHKSPTHSYIINHSCLQTLHESTSADSEMTDRIIYRMCVLSSGLVKETPPVLTPDILYFHHKTHTLSKQEIEDSEGNSLLQKNNNLVAITPGATKDSSKQTNSFKEL